MPEPDNTRWSVIQDAAGGNSEARAEFVRLYEPAIKAYFGARWNHGAGSGEVDDAVQEVFVECFRDRGALANADPGRANGFRSYLYGILRNVGHRFERKWGRKREHPAGSDVDLEAVPAEEDTASKAFDRAWAKLLLKAAARHQARIAREKGGDAARRVDLLVLRFEEGLPIREIADRWDVEAAWLHHQYAQAREEYKRALLDVIRENQSGTEASFEKECRRLLDLLD